MDSPDCWPKKTRTTPGCESVIRIRDGKTASTNAAYEIPNAYSRPEADLPDHRRLEFLPEIADALRRNSLLWTGKEAVHRKRNVRDICRLPCAIESFN